MIIYKIEDVMKEKKVSWYRLFKEGVLTRPSWENYKKGGGFSMKILDSLCNFLNCELNDIVEYAKNGSYTANLYIAKSCIKEGNFKNFSEVCSGFDIVNSNILESLADKYQDALDEKTKENIEEEMMEVLNMDKKIYDFKELVANANKVKEFERVQYLEKIREAFADLKYDINVHLADGSLSRLCNLNNSFCWAEYLDTYLDDWREQHNQEDEDGNIIGTDYYDVTGYEIVEKLTEKEFLELVDTLKDSFEYEVEEYQNLFE